MSLAEVLRRNQIAVVIADEYRKANGIAVALFGMTGCSPGAGRRLWRCERGAAVVPACLIRQPDDGLQLVVEPELQLGATQRKSKRIRENTAFV